MILTPKGTDTFLRESFTAHVRRKGNFLVKFGGQIGARDK